MGHPLTSVQILFFEKFMSLDKSRHSKSAYVKNFSGFVGYSLKQAGDPFYPWWPTLPHSTLRSKKFPSSNSLELMQERILPI